MKSVFITATLFLGISAMASAQSSTQQRMDNATNKPVQTQTVERTQVNEEDAKIARYKAMDVEQLKTMLARYENKLAANLDRAEEELAPIKRDIANIKAILADKEK